MRNLVYALSLLHVTGFIPVRESLAQRTYREIYDDQVQWLKPERTGPFSENTDVMWVGWANSYKVVPIMWMYKATGERKWLDLIVWWGDGYFSNLHMDARDHPGGPAWRTTARTPAYIYAAPSAGNTSPATIEPKKHKIAGDDAARIRDATYTIVVTGPKTLELLNGTTVLKRFSFVSGERFEILPSVKLFIVGNPAQGDRFPIAALSAARRTYMVCEGRGLTPFCLFIEEVLNSRQLDEIYGQKARYYLSLIEKIVAKYDVDWVDIDEMAENPYSRRGGVYRVRDAEGQLSLTLPHNQYSAMAEGMAVLYRVTKKPYYLKRVTKLATYMKSCLSLEDDCYEWHYLSQTGPWDARDRPHIERTGYAAMDLGFVLEAYHSGIVFTETDLERFANTFLRRMWNESMQNPKISESVGGKNGDGVGPLWNWIRLGAVSPQMLDVCDRLIRSRKQHGPHLAISKGQLLYFKRAAVMGVQPKKP